MKKGISYSFIFWIAVCCFLQLGAGAQSLTVSASQNQIRIGEQVSIQIKMDNTSGLSGWVNLPDTFNHFEVIERSKIDTIESGNNVNYIQTITITSFDSGLWQMPVFSVGNITQINPPVSINVLPVDVSGMQDYHDIKDIEPVEPVDQKWIIWIIIAATLMSLAFIYFLYRSKRKPAFAAPVLKGDQTPLDWALEELDKLEEQKLWESGKTRIHFITLVDICRKFFMMELGKSSLHKTTDEWMVELNTLQGDMDIKNAFFQVLRLADTVKFAKFLPEGADSQQAIETARQMMKETAKTAPDFIFAPPPYNSSS